MRKPFGKLVGMASCGLLVGLTLACGERESEPGSPLEQLGQRPMQESGTTGGFDETVRSEIRTNRVRIALLEQLGLDALRLTVSMEGDSVVVSGSVSERANAERAAAVARSVEGVGAVKNRVRVKAGGDADQPAAARANQGTQRELEDALLEARVRLALLQDLGTAARRIVVGAREGTVSLAGREVSDEDRRRALQTAEAVTGVRQVQLLGG